jgi:hypothetical protein
VITGTPALVSNAASSPRLNEPRRLPNARLGAFTRRTICLHTVPWTI